MKSFIFIAAVSSVLLSGGVHAATTVFTSEVAFFAAVDAPYTESFDSLPGQPASPIDFASGSYLYEATSAGFFNVGAPSPGDVWLSLRTATDSIVFSFLSGNIFAVGGYFFTSDIGGAAVAGDLVIEVNDGTSYTALSSTPTTFVGFISDTSVTGLTVTVNQPSGSFQWPTANDLTVGGSNLSPIPEPVNLVATAMLLATGLSARSRRKVNRK